MMAFLILISLILTNNTQITISSSSELINFPTSPVIQSNSQDLTKIFAFINTKSFTIINKYASYNENYFNNNANIVLKKSTIIKPVKYNSIAIACGLAGIIILTESGTLTTEYHFTNYDQNIQCSLLQITSTLFTFAYVFKQNYYINFIVLDLNLNTMNKIYEKIISTRTPQFIQCELFDNSGMILCVYQDIAINGCLFDQVNLLFTDQFHVIETDGKIKIIRTPNDEITLMSLTQYELYTVVFEFNTNSNKIESKKKNVINIFDSKEMELLMYDVVIVETRNIMNYIVFSYLIITCQAYDCFLIRITSSLSMLGLIFTIPSKTMIINTGLSLGIFNDRDATMIITQGTKNYFLTFTLPSCLREREIFYFTDSYYYFHTINDDSKAEIIIIEGDSIEQYFLISNTSKTLQKHEKYNVIDIVFKSKIQGDYILYYKIIYATNYESIDCSLIFHICFQTCGKCSSYGSVAKNKCVTCAIGYHPSIIDTTNCEVNIDQSDEIKHDCNITSTFWLESLQSCVPSCIPYNLLNNMITFHCVTKCFDDHNEILNLMTSECISNEQFYHKIESYISNIDFYIIPLYKYYPIWNTDTYTMSIYNTSSIISSHNNDEENYSIDIIITSKNSCSTSHHRKNRISYASMVYLNKCENILKEKNNLDITKPLIIAKFDTVSPMQLTTIVDYKIYSIEGKKIDQSPCNDTEIITISPVVHINNPQYLLAKNYSIYHHIDLFDHNDNKNIGKNNSFFYDICNQYTTNETTDMPLIDRFNELFLNEAILCYPHYSHYNKIDYEKNTIICSCIKNNTNLINHISYQQSYNYLQNFLSSFKIKSNLGVFKCYHIAFDKNRLMSNVGSWFVLLFIIFEAIIAIYFSIFGHQLFEIDLLDFRRNKKETTIMTHKRKKFTSSIKYIASSCKDKQSTQKSIYNLKNNQKKPVSFFIGQKRKNNNNQIQLYKVKVNNSEGIKYFESSIEYDQIIKGISNESKNNENNNNNFEENSVKKQIDKTDNNIKSIPFQQKMNNLYQPQFIRNNQQKEADIKQQDHPIDIYNLSNNNLKRTTSNTNAPNSNSNNNFNPIEKMDDISFNHNNKSNNNKISLTTQKILNYYWWSLQHSHPIIRCFCLTSVKKTTRILYLSMIFFCIPLNFSINTLLYTMSHVSKSYKSKGRIDYSYNIHNVFYSFLLSLVFKFGLNWLSSFELIIKALKRTNESEERGDIGAKLNIINWFKCRLSSFYIIVVVILLLLWYYVTTFCAVYPNNQLPLLLCCFSCIIIQLLFPLIISALLLIVFILNVKYQWKRVIGISDYLIMMT